LNSSKDILPSVAAAGDVLETSPDARRGLLLAEPVFREQPGQLVADATCPG
jgi:hypothetical protein